MIYLAYDIGTTSLKASLVAVEKDRDEANGNVLVLSTAIKDLSLFTSELGEAEQDADEWWTVMCSATKELLKNSGISSGQVDGISFCTQMCGMVLLDKDGNVLRRPINYMDRRASKEMNERLCRGLHISGIDIFLLIKSILSIKVAPLSVTDVIWKYKWVEKNEPQVFNKAFKWVDVKSFFINKCTGAFVTTPDEALVTGVYDIKAWTEGWKESFCKTYGVNRNHLATLHSYTDVAGILTESAASEIGLKAGTKVFCGAGDSTAITVGAGCCEVGSSYIYLGTSGWLSIIVDEQIMDMSRKIWSLAGPKKGSFCYTGGLNTAGKCFDWLKNHIILDTMGVYGQKEGKGDAGLFDRMSKAAESVPPGSGGLIFAPWLTGIRCPVENGDIGGIFYGISLDTGKSEMIRAVLEGMAYHIKWVLDGEEKKVKIQKPIRFVGGVANSTLMCQILADVIDRELEVIHSPQYAGAVGAALIAAVGDGYISDLSHAERFVHADKKYTPNPENRLIYEKGYKAFKAIYSGNKSISGILYK